MKKVSGPQVVTSVEASEMPLPAAIQEALGELVGAVAAFGRGACAQASAGLVVRPLAS